MTNLYHYKTKRMRVFEHQVLRLGTMVDGHEFTKNHLQALSKFNEHHRGKFFQILHNAVKFKHYVGALQIGQLTIEILPKIDRLKKTNLDFLQAALLDMLRYCKLIKIESLSHANLSLKTNSILVLYFEIFLKELELLLRKGLIKKYRQKNANIKSLKGRLIFGTHLEKNFLHQDRFFTAHTVYDFNHLINQILFQALEVLSKLLVNPILLERIRKLRIYFPQIDHVLIQEAHFDLIKWDRSNADYQNAIELARLILLHYSPDIRMGKHHLLAILFDMNLVFEEYVYRQLLRLENKDLKVMRQEQRSFWKRRKIKADILLEYHGKNYILDTKWKILQQERPDINDLKQVFIYNQYFNANHAMLIYPAAGDLQDQGPIAFANEGEDSNTYYCQLKFVDLIKGAKLNLDIAKDILQAFDAIQ